MSLKSCTLLHCTYCTVMYCMYCTWQVSPGGPGTISTLASSTAEQAAWPASSSVVRNQNRSWTRRGLTLHKYYLYSISIMTTFCLSIFCLSQGLGLPSLASPWAEVTAARVSRSTAETPDTLISTLRSPRRRAKRDQKSSQYEVTSVDTVQWTDSTHWAAAGLCCDNHRLAPWTGKQNTL